MAIIRNGDLYSADSMLMLIGITHPSWGAQTGLVVSGDTVRMATGRQNHPVVCICWYGAALICNWKSLMEGLSPCYDTAGWKCSMDSNGYRIPSEAEWEYTARGSSGRTYPWGNALPDPFHCLFNQPSAGVTQVGSFINGATPNGIKDLAGNAWEWCNDWFADYTMGVKVDPVGPVSGSAKVRRGGSYYDGEPEMRCASRSNRDPMVTADNITMRLARSRP
jgi:formylglycine-generating enzyme required for sulfatase activity